MAGLYDDLPEPASHTNAQVICTGTQFENECRDQAHVTAQIRPDAGKSRFLTTDDATIHHVLSFLPLTDVGTAWPSCCRLMQYLREDWQDWRHFVRPLRDRIRIKVIQILQVQSRSIGELGKLSATLENVALEGFPGCKPRQPSSANDRDMHSYFELPTPRVVWSLQSEGITSWRGVCSLAIDAGYALLPPWDRGARRLHLPKKIQLLIGVSLWLPPVGADLEHSFPGLYMNVALALPEIFERLADRFPDSPPCLAANCAALIVKPQDASSSLETTGMPTLEDWTWRFCFGPEGYRHMGHGDTEGYRREITVAGRRRWRPPELCFARAGENRQASFCVLLRTRRSVGLLDSNWL
eukprot:TRINITY_DN31209_c0_g1_i1.p1 TRINITY_DN31209_c0_g1~~TRINITY_DN31209_c0_g1_i1.p1  ORF type:complete len:354 (-),score=33.64 TRINITY_DN31209_c0_g1_i1:135-1196(-)